MAERPILFSAPMVKAILLAQKTQTRRAVTKQIVLDWLDQFLPEFVASPENHLSPYGHAGDRLWVRETFKPHPPGAGRTRPSLAIYRADYELSEGPGPWKPAIHMPRWACRLLLDVVAVRIERLQDCSEADAQAEGIAATTAGSYRAGYALLWDSLNEKRGFGWSTNPWVWVVDFRMAA